MYIQAKKFEGTTDELAVQGLPKMMKKDLTAEGCVKSLGDSYSSKAVGLAKQNDIVLLRGPYLSTIVENDDRQTVICDRQW